MSINMELEDDSDDAILENLNESWGKQVDPTRLQDNDQYYGFDDNCGDTWIYPTNYPIREYQYEITKNALFKNTLIVLPTGLGKTFIAAVIMYNFHRWYPRGKVIFMAPTRPLVAQQIEAVCEIMGISKDITAELTGQHDKRTRAIAWKSKSMFFITPQILQIDIVDKDVDLPVHDIRLVIIDEAHKARGNYAYVKVIQAIKEQQRFFRVVALSATPGKQNDDVVEVIQNLMISSMEVRSEDSLDVAPYVHKRHIESVTVPYTDSFRNIRNRLLEIIEPYTKNLVELSIVSNSNKTNRGFLICRQKEFREHNIDHPQRSAVLADLSMCISLSHSLQLLERHGLRIFLNFFNEHHTQQEKYLVWKIPHLKELLETVREMLGPNPVSLDESTISIHENTETQTDDVKFGHPKYSILRKRILKHFENCSDSRAIIFCEYRESVYLIRRMLLENQPLIKPVAFVGKGGTKNITQKQQKVVMNDFRNGATNVLIATCVAEEGIDVGEVDLIICFDINTTNPTRMIQRMGRTGRKRQGKVLMLATEGAEQSILKNALGLKNLSNWKLRNFSRYDRTIFCNSPRLVPPYYSPECIKVCIQPPVVEPTKDTKVPKVTSKSKKSKKSTKPITTSKPIKPSQDLRTFFKSKEKDDLNIPLPTHTDSIDYDFYDDDDDDFDKPVQSSRIYDKNENMSFHESHQIEDLLNSLNTYQLILRHAPLKVKIPGFEQIKSNEMFSKELQEIKNVKRLNLPKMKLQCFPLLFDGNFSEKINFTLEPLEKIKLVDIMDKENSLNINNSLHKDGNFYIDSQFDALRFQENESKYYNQAMHDTTKNTMKLERSEMPMKSSTPLKKSEQKIKIQQITPIKNSPLAKAFNRSYQKQKCKKMSTWEYFKVFSLEDVFCDDVIINLELNDCIDSKKSVSNLFPDDTTDVIVSLEEEKRAPESPVERPESQYTISQILAIVNSEAVKLNDGSQRSEYDLLNISESSKNLNIGTIEDIFGNDDTQDSSIEHISNDIDSASKSHTTNGKYEIDDDESIPPSQPNFPLPRLKSVKTISSLKSTTEFSNKANVNTDQNVNLLAKSATQNSQSVPILHHSIKENYDPMTHECVAPKSPIIAIGNAIVNESPSVMGLPITSISRSPSVSAFPTTSISRSPLVLGVPTTSISRSPLVLGVPTTSISRSPSVLGLSTTSLSRSPSVLNSKLCQRSKIHTPRKLCKSMTTSKEDDDDDDDDDEWIGGRKEDDPILEVTSLIGCRLNRNMKRIIESSDDSSEIDEIPKTPEFKRPLKIQRKRKTKRKKNPFVEEECGVSGSDSGDEVENSQFNTPFVCNISPEHDATGIDMQAKYLQSIKSPIKRRAFRIPECPTRNYFNIFSQEVNADDFSTYKEDSFVVSDEEDVQPDNNELSVLEQAELLLKQRKRKKLNHLNGIKKRRKIIVHDDDSSNEEN